MELDNEQVEQVERRPVALKHMEYAERLHRLNNVLLEGIGREFGVDLEPYRNAAGELDAGGLINARRVVNRLLREACKGAAVNVDPEQAYWLAHAGSAGHDDTAADLLRTDAFTQPVPESDLKGQES